MSQFLGLYPLIISTDPALNILSKFLNIQCLDHITDIQVIAITTINNRLNRINFRYKAMKINPQADNNNKYKKNASCGERISKCPTIRVPELSAITFP